MTRSRIPFSFLLPLLSLLQWTCLVALPITFQFARLQVEARDYIEGGRHLGDITPPESTKEMFVQAVADEPEPLCNFINGINMPANFIELPLDRFLPAWPDTWHPEGLDVLSWRAITFPMYSLPFWWFAGVGIDGLLRRRHLRRLVLIGGCTLFAIFLAMAIGLGVRDNQSFDDPDLNTFVFVGGVLWTLLFASYPAVLFVRWHNSRKATQP